jgi:hypothetical protein
MTLVFLVFAFVCFVLAAVGVSSGRVNLVAAGLAFWVASQFLTR